MKRFKWVIAVLVMGMWAPAFARDTGVLQPDLVVTAPQRAVAGGRAGFTAVFTNSLEQAVAVPDTLELFVGPSNGAHIVVTAHCQGKSGGAGAVIPAKGFLKQKYVFMLPGDMEGILTMTASGSDPVMFTAASQDTAVAKIPEETGHADQAKGGDIREKFQPFAVNFSSYKPVYFLFGVDPGIQGSSFQVSFKYKVFNFDGDSFGKKYLFPLESLRLAYTQQSFWDLKSDSAPFEDSRYMPELFFEYTDLDLKLPYLKTSGFQVGFQHESNGRGGELSKSTNYAYIQPFFAFKFSDRLYWKFAPKAWIYVHNEDESNGDLYRYRGYFDIENKIGDPEGFVLENHYRQGKKGGTLQVDLSYPMNRIPWLKGFMDMYIHAQYVTGYSDQLLEYDQKEDVFRLGFSLVR